MKYFILCGFICGALIFFGLRWFAPSFVFYPLSTLEAYPSDRGLTYEEVALPVGDGVVNGWYIPAVQENGGESLRDGVTENPPRTVLFFHGNGGNISHRLESLAFFHRLGLSVFIIDYRGYGKSTGKASVAHTKEDARAAWDWLILSKGTTPSDIIIFGRSLGGGVAAGLVSELVAEQKADLTTEGRSRQKLPNAHNKRTEKIAEKEGLGNGQGLPTLPCGLILESTFTSLHDVGKTMFPFLPRWVFPDDYTTLAASRSFPVPLLVVHSPDDEIIDYAMGRAIYEQYTGSKWFLRITGSHNGGWYESMAQYEEGVRHFLRQL